MYNKIKVVLTAKGCAGSQGLMGTYGNGYLDINVTYIPKSICISMGKPFGIDDAEKCLHILREKFDNCERLKMYDMGIGYYNVSKHETHFGETENRNLDKNIVEIHYCITYSLYDLEA